MFVPSGFFISQKHKKIQPFFPVFGSQQKNAVSALRKHSHTRSPGDCEPLGTMSELWRGSKTAKLCEGWEIPVFFKDSRYSWIIYLDIYIYIIYYIYI